MTTISLNFTRIRCRYTGCANTDFLRQGFLKSSSDIHRDRQTDTLHSLRHGTDISVPTELSLHFSTPLWFNPPTEGFSWDNLRKIFTEGSQMAKVPKWRRNIAENFNRLSRVHERYRWQMTDDIWQTDRRMTTYSEHEHKCGRLDPKFQVV